MFQVIENMNLVLVSSLLSMLFSQIIKVTLQGIKRKKWEFKTLFASGNMPSSHAAMVSALTLSIALTEGIQSTVFAIALVLSLIVIYDASGVRQAVDQQNIILENLSPKNHPRIKTVGHTHKEVIAGIILGIVIASIIVYY